MTRGDKMVDVCSVCGDMYDYEEIRQHRGSPTCERCRARMVKPRLSSDLFR